MTPSKLPETQTTPSIHAATRSAIRQTLARWYGKNRRDLPWRNTDDPYAIWVSEVMLQQTQVKTVIPYFQRFMEHFPDVHQLARADEQAVLKMWEGLGYYSRARNLQRAARMVAGTMGGRVPSDWPAIRQLPGVGDYIAAAVLSIAFSKPHAVVDGNVKRVLARLFLIETPVNATGGHSVFQQHADALLDRSHPGQHNQAVMELGALVCTPKQPLCDGCPAGRFCKALGTGGIDQFPRRLARKKVGRQLWVAGVVVKSGHVLMTQRPGTGLLAGLWEFPGGVVDNDGDPLEICTQKVKAHVGLEAPAQSHITTVRHAYTHFKLQLEIYLCPYRKGRIRLSGPASFKWIRFDRLSQLPLHQAIHKALPAIGQALSLR